MTDRTPQEPSEADLLINEGIFDRCNHVEWFTVSYSESCVDVVSTACGKGFSAREYEPAFQSNVAELPANYLQFFVPHYSEKPIYEPQIIRRLSALGWSVTFHAEQNGYLCELLRHSQTIPSGVCNSRLRALLTPNWHLFGLDSVQGYLELPEWYGKRNVLFACDPIDSDRFNSMYFQLSSWKRTTLS